MLYIKKIIKNPSWIILFIFIYIIFNSHISVKKLGFIKQNQFIKEEKFELQYQYSSTTNKQGHHLIDIVFYDDIKLNDILLAIDYDNWLLEDVSFLYSYNINERKYTKVINSDSNLVMFNIKSAIGGIAIRQPFPKESTKRHFIIQYNIEDGDRDSYGEGYIAIGKGIYRCNIMKGIEKGINSIYRSNYFTKLEAFHFIIINESKTIAT